MRMRPAAWLLTNLLALALVAGCSGKGAKEQGGQAGNAPPPAPELRTAADSLAWFRDQAAGTETRLGTLQKVDGQLRRGDAATAFSAWFDGGQLRSIREDIDLGPYGSRTNRYYFDDRGLRYVSEAGMTLAGSATKPEMTKFEREMLFDAGGHLAASRKMLGTQTADVQAFEGLAAHGHAHELALAADSLRAAPAGDSGAARKPS